MTKPAIRSPSYPSMGLAAAIEAVGQIEGIYRTAPVDRAEGAKLIGYSSLSGPANKALAALAAFGLVERAGKARMRVTQLAVRILHGESDADRDAAIGEAARQPKLFQEIWDHFEGLVVPPEGGVISYLNRAGFNPTAVKPAARAFLETAQEVEKLTVTESHSDSVRESLDSDDDDGDDDAPSPDRRRKRKVKAGMKEDVYTLSEGDVVFQWPDTLSSESYQDLKDWMELMLRKVSRHVQPENDDANKETD